MCLTLIITGEIQVDIRLLISLKSKEGLKRDIITHPFSAVSRTSGNTLSGISQPAIPAEFLHVLQNQNHCNDSSDRYNAGSVD